jgi:hypothetical protein
LLAIGAAKDHSSLCQGVDVRRFGFRMAKAANIGPQVIDGKKEDVGFEGRLLAK